MKRLLYTFGVFILLYFSIPTVKAQQLSIQPAVICSGDQATFVIDLSFTSKPVDHIVWYYGDGRLGVTNSTSTPINMYTWNPTPTGIFSGSATIYFSATDSLALLPQQFTVYHRPIADFHLDLSNDQDTQCFNNGKNSFCFINTSSQNTNMPSNPITSCQWIFGDGSFVDDCTSPICHSFLFSAKFNVTLRITDTKGCWTDITNPSGSSGGLGNGIVVVPNSSPNFTWSMSNAYPCFGTTYVFDNTSSIKASDVKSYTWDFGDGTRYSSSNSLDGHFDTISHKYTLNGEFYPSLIIENQWGCIDTLKRTPFNTSFPRLPYNVAPDMKITSSKLFNGPNMDSFCVDNNLYTPIYFSHPYNSYIREWNGDFVWDFGDPENPELRNRDSFTYTPYHNYYGIGKYVIKFSIKNVCPDTSVTDTIEILGPQTRIENPSLGITMSMVHKFQCDGKDTVDFVNTSSYYKSNYVKRLWDFDDAYAPACTSYSVPKPGALLPFATATEQYNNSDHYYIRSGTTYTGKMNCRWSMDSLPRHVYTNWDSVYQWYLTGKTFPVSSGITTINANAPLTISNTRPVPDPFWQAQGRVVNLTSGTFLNKNDSITCTIPGFGTFKRYGNQKLPNSTLTFHEYVFRYVVAKSNRVELTLKDSLAHASGSLIPCESKDYVLISHEKPDAHGMTVTGKQCPGIDPTGRIEFNLGNFSSFAGTKPSCGQTYIYVNVDSLADRMDQTPGYLDGFTSWGLTDANGNITPGPGMNITPGGLYRNTFYSRPNWNPLPPSPWQNAAGTRFTYHYGGNSGTPPPADTANGFITIGLFIGSGYQDSTISVWQSDYNVDPSYYQNLVLTKQVRNFATPPPMPIPNGWVDDHMTKSYTWNAIINKTPQLRSSVWDTLLTLQYLDRSTPRCVSDTVWYHNFLHINYQDPSFYKSPADLSTLRERGDTITIVYHDEIQDSVNYIVLGWGDRTVTVDSFFYAGYDLTDGYYTHGVRRVRYEIDYTNYPDVVITDSIVWPCGVYGQRQYQKQVRSYLRRFDIIGTISPDTLILVDKLPSTKHFDQWYPYTNYHDTIHLQMADTVNYGQFITIDSALMLLPVTHVIIKTSWEIGEFARQPGSNNTEMYLFIQSKEACQYESTATLTIGIIDTLQITNAAGNNTTIFCTNNPVHFNDSLRYFRYDNTRTDPMVNPDGDRNGPYGFPYDSWYIDTTDFWHRDLANPSDSIGNTNDPYWLNKSQFEFKYYPGKWTHWDENGFYYTQAIGHWDLTIRGGDVPVLFPSASNDPYNTVPQVGTIMFYPGENPGITPSPTQWGARRGLYSWTSSGNWSYINNPQPAVINTLNSYTDGTVYPGPGVLTPGRTLIFNDGKGAIKRVGMYYWDGARWQFICNSRYTTFPYVTHRLYWDFGDGSPIYQGVKPIHSYQNPGIYKVKMISRDSIGHFDTCFSQIVIQQITVNPVALQHSIGCQDAITFTDSSFLNSGSISQRYWWFGDQETDTITPQSVLASPSWQYEYNGKFRVKLKVITSEGCSAIGYDSVFKTGPRPKYKLISDTSGCAPFKVRVVNISDKEFQFSPADTPTRCAIFYWGDGSSTTSLSHNDTLEHVYASAGIFPIVVAGRDALPTQVTVCPVVYYPDTINGQKAIYVRSISTNLDAISGSTNPMVSSSETYSVSNDLQASFIWTVTGGTIQSGAGTHEITIAWPSSGGTYEVIVTKTSTVFPFCSDRDTLDVHVLNTAVKELSTLSSIYLYPNPASIEVTLNMNSLKTQDLTVRVYDMLGKLYINDTIKSATGNIRKEYTLASLRTGMYFVEISNGQEKTITKLIVK